MMMIYLKRVDQVHRNCVFLMLQKQKACYLQQDKYYDKFNKIRHKDRVSEFHLILLNLLTQNISKNI